MTGIIFDMDGTLLDSMGGWAGVGERYLQKHGLTPKGLFADSLVHVGQRGFAEHVREQYGVTDTVDAVVDEVHLLMGEFYQTVTAPREGLKDYLEALKAQGVRMCVATATARSLAVPTLERLGLLSFFEAVFVCGELHTDKTKPLIYDTARASLGTALEDTWVFEDALYAAKTAKAAGYRLCAVADAHEAHQEAMSALADVYITSYAETARLPFGEMTQSG